MNKNQNIAMGISLAVVAIMVGSAEIFGEKEIIFPEITAVAMGALIAPVQSWNTSRTRLFAAIVSAAVAGVCIVRFIPEILILRIALGLLVAVSVITLSKTSFVPAISACILPILMGTKSPVYVISVAVMTAFILIFQKVLEYFGLHEKYEYRPIEPSSELLKLRAKQVITVLVICIWANSFLVSVFTALTMLFLIIFIGKTSYKNVFHLMTVPIVFIIMGAAAIAISIGQNSSDMLFSLHFGNTYFGVSHTSLLSAVRVMIKCFGAVSCMYFLSLTTPMVDLFTLLRKSIIPNFIIEIAELIYRYIFVLFDVSHRIHTAQDARLGYSNLRVSYHSTAQLASNLFIRSFNQAEKTYTAMESRGYDGEINVIMPKINHSVKFNVFAVIYVVITTAIAIFSRKAGI